MHSLFGWRGAFLGAAALGLAVAVLVLLMREPRRTAGREAARRRQGRRQGQRRQLLALLLSAPILINFVFFMLLAFGSFGLQNFSVVALGALYGTSRSPPTPRCPAISCSAPRAC